MVVDESKAAAALRVEPWRSTNVSCEGWGTTCWPRAECGEAAMKAARGGGNRYDSDK